MNSDIKRIGTGARMSEGVCYNGIIWLAGQVGNPGESVADQTRTCLAEVDRILPKPGPTRPASSRPRSGWPILPISQR